MKRVRDVSRPTPIYLARIAASVALVVCASGASAAVLSFQADVGGTMRVAQVEAYLVEDTLYVPLPTLVAQFGGGWNRLPTRLRVDIGGASAWVDINDNRVNAISLFSLRKPIVAYDEHVLIAAADVADFFSKAFQITVTSPNAEPDSDVSERDVANLDMTLRNEDVESQELLEFRSMPAQRPVNVIVLDPGHGGNDVGLTTPDGLQEKDFTLAISKRIQAVLAETLEKTYYLTREEDRLVSWRDRAIFANDNKGDLLVSIHASGSLSPEASGAVIMYRAPEFTLRRGPAAEEIAADYAAFSENLALNIAAHLDPAFPVRGIHKVRTPLLNGVMMPSILIEVGHMTNVDEAERLFDSDVQEKIAQAIAQGIAGFVNTRENAPDEAD